MYKIGSLQESNQLSENSFSKLEKVLLTSLEFAIFFEVFVYNFAVFFVNKSKDFYDTATFLHQTTKQKIVDNKSTVVVFGQKMKVEDKLS